MNPAATGFPVLTRENLNEVAMGSYSPKLADSSQRVEEEGGCGKFT